MRSEALKLRTGKIRSLRCTSFKAGQELSPVPVKGSHAFYCSTGEQMPHALMNALVMSFLDTLKNNSCSRAQAKASNFPTYACLTWVAQGASNSPYVTGNTSQVRSDNQNNVKCSYI